MKEQLRITGDAFEAEHCDSDKGHRPSHLNEQQSANSSEVQLKDGHRNYLGVARHNDMKSRQFLKCVSVVSRCFVMYLLG